VKELDVVLRRGMILFGSIIPGGIMEEARRHDTRTMRYSEHILLTGLKNHK
jgi:hypothetical protein